MTEAQNSTTVDVPIGAAFAQWTDLESFPRFLDAVANVETTSETYSHWTISVGRATREFDAEILEQLPDERFAWRTIGGDLVFSGRAEFDEVDEHRTRVTLTVVWQPGTATERAAAVLGVDDRTVRSVLRSFKEYTEATGGPSTRSRITLTSIDGDEPPAPV
jgi:uncharacterized membrane protein